MHRPYFALLACIATLTSFHNAKVEARNPDADILHGVSRRFDYHHTFKKPFFYNYTLPFFDIIGNALTSSEFLRLTSSTPFQHTAIWAQRPNTFPEWQVDIVFHVSGKLPIGGKGIAFWYTRERGEEMQPQNHVRHVMGVRDDFDGLGIFLDTSDESDGRTVPIITAHLNDGTKHYADIKSLSTSMTGGCFRDYRNAQHPMRVRISYIHNSIKVQTDASGTGAYFIDCFTVSGIDLQPGSYFGISSSTSEKPDDHDVYSFETWELNPPNKPKAKTRPKENEAIKKQGGEYHMSSEQQRKFEEIERVVESMASKEHHEDDFFGHPGGLQHDDSKVNNQDQLQKKIEMLTQLLTSGGGHPSTPSSTESGGFSSEVNKIQSQLQELKNTLSTLSTTVQALRSNLDTMTSHTTTVDSSLSQLRNDVAHLASRIDKVDTNSKELHSQTRQFITQSHQQTLMERVPGTAKFVFLVALSQIILLVAYNSYKKRQDRNEKKFI